MTTLSIVENADANLLKKAMMKGSAGIICRARRAIFTRAFIRRDPEVIVANQQCTSPA